MIIAVAGGVVVCLLFYVLAIRPRQSELSDVRAQIDTENARTQELRSTLAQLEALQRQAPRLQADLAEIRELVPEDDQLANFIFQLQESANAAGVDFVEVTPELPKTPPENAPLAQIRVTLGAQGGYFSVQDFIRRLYDLDRALRLDGMTLAQISTNEADVTFTATARVFYELPAGTVPGAATAPTGTTGEVPPPAPAPTTSP
jgi:Tfp pilus assembly protein PilO